MKTQKQFLIISLILILAKELAATQISDYVDTKKCDQIIDKDLYSICYSYKYKGAVAGWSKLDGELVHLKNIKKRPRFYNEKTIPMRYRTKHKDYTHTKMDRGHIIASDADFDYSEKAVRKTYTMANIVPQYPKVNRHIWIKVEKYGRNVAKKLGYLNTITIVDYRGAKNKIKNNITIPSGMYRILYNDAKNFKKCFYFKNIKNQNIKDDRLKHHLVSCSDIKFTF